MHLKVNKVVRRRFCRCEEWLCLSEKRPIGSCRLLWLTGGLTELCMIIDALPIWVLFLITAALVVLAVEIGFRVGKMVRTRSSEERKSPVSAIAGAVLGLLAFMLAFTFSIVSERYDTKKGLVREEANVLRAAWQ